MSTIRGGTNAARSRATRHASDKATPQLSCESCQERKVKCDKLSPCTNCRKIGVTCIPVHRKRLPRGRHVQKDSDMRDRIRRLEALVSNLDSKNLAASTSSIYSPDLIPSIERSPPGSDSIHSQHTKSPTSWQAPIRVKEESASSPSEYPNSQHSIGRQFWEELVQEVSDLKGILEDESGDEYDPDSTLVEEDDQKKSRRESAHSYPPAACSSILGTGSMYAAASRSLTLGSLALRPPPKLYKELCRIYMKQVDPLMKVVHGPSVEKFMLEDLPYLNYDDGDPNVEALSAAICYAAVASRTPEQSMSMFQSSRRNIAAEYRLVCEAALERAALVITTDITVLQAFYIYLVATRSVEHNRTVWTLMPTLVRIARALAVDRDDVWPSETFFDQQMRRRLWHSISWLDLHTSFARGSEPLISPHEQLSHLPKNLNDLDFGPNSKDDVPEVDGFSDMTFSIMVYNAQRIAKILNFAPTNEMKANESDATYNWDAREKLADEIQREIYRVSRNIDPTASPYAWFCRISSRTFASAMRLSVLRPMHRSGMGAPPRIRGGAQVLKLSAVVLESSCLTFTDPRGEQFRWYMMVQWHALAVSISECYECKDTDLLRRVWPLVEALFEHHKEALADQARDNKLWKPLEKLMKQTRIKIHSILPPDDRAFLGGPGKDPLSRFIGQNYQQLPLTGTYMDLSIPLSMDSIANASQTPSAKLVDSGSVQTGAVPISNQFQTEGMNIQDPPLISMPPWYYPPENAFAPQDPMNQQQQQQQLQHMQIQMQQQQQTPPQGNGSLQVPDPAWGTWESFVNVLSTGDTNMINFSPSTGLEQNFSTDMNLNM